MDQRTGIAAILSILAAIASYILTCSGHAGWALLSGVIAVPLALVGLLMAASPKVSGGILSIVAIMLAAGGIVVAILGLVGALAAGG